MKDTAVLVIIVTYNGIKWLKRCLDSVKNSTIKTDLFIVDNGSSDGSIDYMSELYPDTKIVISNKNLGFGKANNLGLQYAVDNNYDYVYLLNQDAWVEKDTFEKLIQVNQNYPEYGILSPLQTNREKTKLDYNFSTICPLALTSDLICQVPIKPVYEVKFVMAAHWLISKECLLKVGGFSPVFPHYGEDVDYINRTFYHGLKIGIVPTTIGVHDRENRGLSSEKKIYLYQIGWRHIIINPNIKSAKKLKEILIRVNSACRISFSKTFAYMIRFIFDLPKLFKFAKEGRTSGAFIEKK